MAEAPQQTPVEERPDAPVAALRARLRELTLRDEHRLGRRLDKLRRTATRTARPRAREPRRRDRAGRGARRAPPRRRARGHLSRRSCRSAPAATTCWRRSATTRSSSSRARPGSGKTTQLPKICLELGRGVRGAIGHTQPRRLAARTVAERIADELDVPLGDAVGYAVRFTDRSSEDTLVRLMTDGLLLAEIQRDRLLRRYDTIIVDEAHERSLNIDFLLGYLAADPAAAARPEADHHLGDDRPASASPRTSATRRSSRCRAARTRSRSATARVDADDRRRRRPRPDRRDRRRRRRAAARAAAATCSCSSPASARSATPPTRCAAALPRPTSRSCRSTRGCPTAEQQRVFKPHTAPPRRARHQRRRDVADRARASATSSTPAPRASAATARG